MTSYESMGFMKNILIACNNDVKLAQRAIDLIAKGNIKNCPVCGKPLVQAEDKHTLKFNCGCVHSDMRVSIGPNGKRKE